LRWRGQSFKPCERTAGSADLFRGLAQSENTIALRVAQDAGLDRTVQFARAMGIQSPLEPVPGLVLGQSEVNLLELTGAYGTFANRGLWHRPHGIRRILDGGDCTDPKQPQTCREIYNFTEDGAARHQAIAPTTAQTMTAMLRGVITGGTGSGAAIGLGEAGKTGTTNNGVDLWFVGFIPSRHWVTGVWLGNDDNSPTRSSSAQAASLWSRYMGSAAKN
jgi:membrane peptidoglycan carboxypeptidase